MKDGEKNMSAHNSSIYTSSPPSKDVYQII